MVNRFLCPTSSILIKSNVSLVVIGQSDGGTDELKKDGISPHSTGFCSLPRPLPEKTDRETGRHQADGRGTGIQIDSGNRTAVGIL